MPGRDIRAPGNKMTDDMAAILERATRLLAEATALARDIKQICERTGPQVIDLPGDEPHTGMYL